MGAVDQSGGLVIAWTNWLMDSYTYSGGKNDPGPTSNPEIYLRRHAGHNHPPVADAGLTPTDVIAANGAISAIVALNGSASSDPDGDALSYSWTVDGVPAGSGPQVSFEMAVNLPHTVVLTVDDGFDSDTDTVLVTVESPAAAATSLISVVTSIQFLDGSTTANSLTSTLTSASASFASGSIGSGINKLQAFQNKVRAKAGKTISAADAAELISLAQDIINSQ